MNQDGFRVGVRSGPRVGEGRHRIDHNDQEKEQ